MTVFSFVVKERRAVRGQLEREVKSREGFLKMGKLITRSGVDGINPVLRER